MSSTAGLRRRRVGAVARVVGISPATLRLWERHALLIPRRTASGYRVYSEEDLARARDIKRLRRVQGLNLAAIRAVLGEGKDGGKGVGVAGRNGHLGQKLHHLRQRRRLTLRDVSARTGLSPSFVNSLERTSSGASVASLKKLARCYGVTVTSLTAAPRQRERRVVRVGRRRILPMFGPGITVEQLAEGPALMDCQRWRLAPGAGSHGAYSHGGEEFIHVLEGRFEVVLDGKERYLLKDGDSIYFRSTATHAWRNPGPEQTVLLWVNTPPTF
jgi:DNA-binding transcriptional MerR regulator/quercetin dioxygenase-like cupin family protein